MQTVKKKFHPEIGTINEELHILPYHIVVGIAKNKTFLVSFYGIPPLRIRHFKSVPRVTNVISNKSNRMFYMYAVVVVNTCTNINNRIAVTLLINTVRGPRPNIPSTELSAFNVRP